MKRFMKSVFPLMGVLLYVAVASCSDDGEIGKPLFEMSMNKSTLALEVGKSETLVVSYNPSDTPNQGHTWGSSNPEIATVDESGKVTAEAIGECTVTARSLTGNVTTTCNVKVVDKIIHVTSISLDKTTAELATGETLALEATILPSNATNKGVKWTSSSNEVAIVNAEGVVSAVAEGETTITVTTDDNSKKATCKLTVVPEGDEPIELITHFEPYEYLLELDGNCDITLSSVAPKGYKTINVCYGTNPDPKITNNAKTLTVENDGKFYLEMKNLNCNSTYYVRSYSKIGTKIEYSDDIVVVKPPIFTKNGDTARRFWNEERRTAFYFNGERINYWYYVNLNFYIHDGGTTYLWESLSNKDTKFYHHSGTDDYEKIVYTPCAGIVTMLSDFKDRNWCKISLTNIETNIKYILTWTY